MPRILPAMLDCLHRRMLLAAPRLRAAHRGQALAEYAILLSLVTLVVIGTIITFGQGVAQFLLDTACYIGLTGGC
jgi:Flp pilus assembly pilin Flp